jgi:hypothetical protein
MALQLEDIGREALGWPRERRLALARILLEPDGPDAPAGVEAAWESEICARVRAVEQGRETGIPYDEFRREMQARNAR